MTRPIKFRAWDKKHEHWMTLDLGTPVGEWKKNLIPYTDHDTEPDFSDWMQFTGLLDKNGKEIYEGDILKAYGLCHGGSEVGSVIFGKYVTDNDENEDILGWCFACPDRYHALDPQSTWEVIGNIYSNPELLRS